MGEGMIRKGVAVAVILLFIVVAFAPSINATKDPVPDLDCDGMVIIGEWEPDIILEGEFTVENIGEPLSKLDWEIESYPDWGVWTFDPISGEDLTPEDGPITIICEIILPEEPEDEWDEIKIVNLENNSDFCIIDVNYHHHNYKTVEKLTWIWGNPSSLEIIGNGFLQELEAINEDNSTYIRIRGWAVRPPIDWLPFRFVGNAEYVLASSFLCIYKQVNSSGNNFVFGIAFGDIEWS